MWGWRAGMQIQDSRVIADIRGINMGTSYAFRTTTDLNVIMSREAHVGITLGFQGFNAQSFSHAGFNVAQFVIC